MTQQPTAEIRTRGGIPRYRSDRVPAFLSAGFRPFFLLAALWAALGVPLWIAALGGQAEISTAMSPVVWHAHEMIFGFGTAAVAGFLLTAIPNWTGRMPLQGLPLAGLAALWTAGRLAVLVSGPLGAGVAMVADLAFPAAFLGVVAREIIAGRNWRNAPMLLALGFLLAGNLLVHLEALHVVEAAELGIRLGISTLLMLISLVGGRIIPSFTHNWLAKRGPQFRLPAQPGRFDVSVLIVTALALALWVVDPDAVVLPMAQAIAAILVAIRLVRWRGYATLSEPLLWILHLGYAWVAIGFGLSAISGLSGILPSSAALHAFSAGAIGTMTLAVMTRASLGHTGHPLTAGPLTAAIFALVSGAAVLRIAAPLADSVYFEMLCAAALAWCGAFGLFAVAYGRVLIGPRSSGGTRPI